MKRLYKKFIKKVKDEGDVRALLDEHASETFSPFTATDQGKRNKLRAYAARTLEKISDPDAANYFFHPAPAGQYQGEPLIFALAQIYYDYARHTNPNPCEDIKKLVPLTLEVALQADHPHRDKAIIALGLLQHSSTFGLLLSLLREKDRDVRIAVSVSLSYFKDIRACVPMMRAYNEGDDQFKESVGGEKNLIGRYYIREETLLQDFLLEAAQDEDADVRLSAAIGLGRLGNPIAIETLLYCLHHEQDPDIRSMAVSGLARIENLKAFEGLKLALASEEEEVVCSALVEISYYHFEDYGKLEQDVISILSDSTSEEVCCYALEALVALGASAALKVIEEKLEEKIKARETRTKIYEELTLARDCIQEGVILCRATF